jgi:hypothetical protein
MISNRLIPLILLLVLTAACVGEKPTGSIGLIQLDEPHIYVLG